MNKKQFLSYYEDNDKENRIKSKVKIIGVFSTDEEKCDKFFNNLYKEFKAKNMIKILSIGTEMYINEDDKKILWLTNDDRYIWYNSSCRSMKGARVTDAYIDENIVDNDQINLVLHVTTYCSSKDINFF